MVEAGDYAIGLDLGTSGCRAVAMDPSGRILAVARATLPSPLSPQPGWSEQDPGLWWDAAKSVLGEIAGALPDREAAAICVDGTSATLLLCDPDGTPRGPALMYNDRRAGAQAEEIDREAPSESPARGPSSSLAKLRHLHLRLAGSGRDGETLALHQADWLGGRLCGQVGWSDWNNALKLGYDVERLCWPGWVRGLVPAGVRLPRVLAPGTPAGILGPDLAVDIGLSPSARIVAGTTDSTAAAIAAGASRPGDAVTSLGSTLVVKILCERPIVSSGHGVYSHRFGSLWLAGGASNSGGVVLRQLFDPQELIVRSREIDPECPSGLDYYPLLGIGERFPRADPKLKPRLTPRPADRTRFLQGVLEGLAAIEAEGYRLLARLGAPMPARVVSIGGGACNPAWTRLRERALGVPVIPAAEQEAAAGSARLAVSATRRWAASDGGATPTRRQAS